jgi:hypothetical protein
MSPLKLKRFAGRMKYKMLECWPYVFRARRGKKMRRRLQPMLDLLPTVNTTGDGELEIHMLCGKKQIDMGMWASWSIMRFFESASLYVHSDGTLSEEDMGPWRRIVPQVVLIGREQADKRIEQEIGPRWPKVKAWRDSYRTSPQLVDVQLFGKARRLLVMDSDIICFREPVEVKQFPTPAGGIMRWHRDARTCYVAAKEILSEIIGAQLPEALNCGFLFTDRFCRKHFDILEAALHKLSMDRRVRLARYWATQTLYAVVAAFSSDAKPLPDAYAIGASSIDGSTILCHYPGTPKLRPLYFLEGVPRLLKDLEKEKITGCAQSQPAEISCKPLFAKSEQSAEIS